MGFMMPVTVELRKVDNCQEKKFIYKNKTNNLQIELQLKVA